MITQNVFDTFAHQLMKNFWDYVCVIEMCEINRIIT
jgi:hypothetical protein